MWGSSTTKSQRGFALFEAAGARAFDLRGNDVACRDAVAANLVVGVCDCDDASEGRTPFLTHAAASSHPHQRYRMTAKGVPGIETVAGRVYTLRCEDADRPCPFGQRQSEVDVKQRLVQLFGCGCLKELIGSFVMFFEAKNDDARPSVVAIGVAKHHGSD